MAVDYYILYSPERSSLLNARNEVSQKLKSLRYAFQGPIDLKPVPGAQAKRITNRQKISDPLHGWLREANCHRVDYFISEHNAEKFWGTAFGIPPRHTEAEKHVGNCIRRQEVRLVKRESKSTKYIPFSYDPKDTYVTEPDS